MKTIFNFVIILVLGVPFSCNANHDTKETTGRKKHTREIYTHKTDPNTRNIQVALLLDTSNSMDGLIDQAKAQLWEIINELSYAQCKNHHIDLQIALYEYGNDNLPAAEGHIRQVTPFSNDLDKISKELFALTTNGGNEFCGEVIQAAINRLDWKKNNSHLKLIFIAGNESFAQGSLNYQDAAINAKEKGISVNTIFCGNYQQGIKSKWKHGADITSGEYAAIDHNQKTVHIPTPYDTIILELNTSLNDTYIYYGHQGISKRNSQKEEDTNALVYSKANAVSRAISKSSGFYTNKSWDLIDAVEDPSFSIENISKNNLPKSLQNVSTETLENIIASKSKKRQEIKQKIQEFNKKRKLYLQKNAKQKQNNLETALLDAIRKQGEQKSFSWDE